MNKQEGGFTLLEVLVALAILGAALAVFYEALSGSSHAATTARDDRRITAAAANILAEIGHLRPLEAGTTSGKLPSGQGWIIKIDKAFQATASLTSITGYNVDLEISRGIRERDDKFVIHTFLLGPPR